MYINYEPVDVTRVLQLAQCCYTGTQFELRVVYL